MFQVTTYRCRCGHEWVPKKPTPTGAAQMLGYAPILKGKPAEIWAWANASPTVLSASRVVFEVVPTETKTPSTTNFVNRLTRNYPAGQVIAVDCGLFGQNSIAVTEISQALIQKGVNERPVFQLSDTPAIISQIHQACILHGQGACLRLGSDDEDPDPSVSTQDVLDAVGSIGLNTSQIDLIIDFKVVDSARDITRCVPLALNMLAWASSFGNWRSVTLARSLSNNSFLETKNATQYPAYSTLDFVVELLTSLHSPNYAYRLEYCLSDRLLAVLSLGRFQA